jgi:hypothetical protein
MDLRVRSTGTVRGHGVALGHANGAKQRYEDGLLRFPRIGVARDGWTLHLDY